MTKVEQLLKRRRAVIVNDELKHLYRTGLTTPLEYTTPIDLLVAVVLSAQNTDNGVNKVTQSLFKKYKTAKDYTEVELKELERDLSSINYYRTKARHIQSSMKIIVKDFDGKVPDSMEELLKLPGVGRKTANVVLGHLYGVVEGIAVDTHVIRLARKFGLAGGKDAARIERELMDIIPQDEWWDFSYMLKAYGREYSPARSGFDDPISLILERERLLPRPVRK